MNIKDKPTVNKEKQEGIDKKLSEFNKLKDELQKEGVL